MCTLKQITSDYQIIQIDDIRAPYRFSRNVSGMYNIKLRTMNPKTLPMTVDWSKLTEFCNTHKDQFIVAEISPQ